MSPVITSNKPPSDARAKAVEFLLKAVDRKDGWFPYKPGGECSLEATSWALIAIAREHPTETFAGLNYLADHQNKIDGGWSTRPGAGKSDWTSGPALLCLRLVQSIDANNYGNIGKSAAARAVSYLLDSRVEFFGPTARLLLLISKGKEGLAYARGWPWDPKCFHWIEPTAYCLMALKLPQPPDSEAQRTVIKFADKFITEHACKDGGWNHGNDLTLGSYLPPYRLTTAEALLALQDDPGHKTIKPALTYLESQSKDDSSSLSLAMSILALTAYDRPCQQELAFLLQRQALDGSFGPTVMSTALAALALDAAQGKNVLKIVEPAKTK